MIIESFYGDNTLINSYKIVFKLEHIKNKRLYHRIFEYIANNLGIDNRLSTPDFYSIYGNIAIQVNFFGADCIIQVTDYINLDNRHLTDNIFICDFRDLSNILKLFNGDNIPSSDEIKSLCI